MAPKPFVIDIPQSSLDDLGRRLAHTRLPADFDNESARMGVRRSDLEPLLAYWADGYDWRAEEEKINAFSHFKVDIDGSHIHFIHQKGKGPNPRPLILSHGWPWTFWDYCKVIGPLADPASHGGNADDAYDVIVPSLPGFGFSTPLTKSGIGFTETADIFKKLMVDVLGYERFFAAGGDYGNLVTSQLGHKYSEHVIALHITGAIPLGLFTNDMPLMAGGPDWGFARPAKHPENPHLHEPGRGPGHPTAHLMVQGLEPQTLSYGIHDSPVGLLAWMYQRRYWWADHDDDLESVFDRDFLLTTMMIYWLTESFSTSVRFYAESMDHPWQPSHDGMPVVTAPTGISFFDHDLVAQTRFWVEDYYNLVYTNSHKTGGHFAASERPDDVVADIRAMFSEFKDA